MYVPKELVGLLKKALKNGRKIEELLYQTGPELIRAYRQSRVEAKGSKTTVSSTRSMRSVKNGKAKS